MKESAKTFLSRLVILIKNLLMVLENKQILAILVFFFGGGRGPLTRAVHEIILRRGSISLKRNPYDNLLPLLGKPNNFLYILANI